MVDNFCGQFMCPVTCTEHRPLNKMARNYLLFPAALIASVLSTVSAASRCAGSTMVAAWYRIQMTDRVLNVMAHAQKPDFVFRRNGWVHLNRRGRQFSRLLVAEVCASAVVMLDTPCTEVVWRVLATHSIRQFPLHSPSRASPCAITFQLDSNT